MEPVAIDPKDHSGRTEKYWMPGLGPCVCDHCRKLPDRWNGIPGDGRLNDQRAAAVPRKERQ